MRPSAAAGALRGSSALLAQAVAGGSPLLAQAVLSSQATGLDDADLPRGLASLGEDGLRLRDLARGASRLLVLTGAGISTASGIPDYRSPGRPAYRPLQHAEFMARPSVRRRYWARSMIGWARMAGAAPNGGHAALAALQRGGRLGGGLITQNVDRLHQAAGAVGVLELHGTVHEVGCEACGGWRAPRGELQGALVRDNAAWVAAWAPSASARPDGDVELPEDAYAAFAPPTCPLCGSDLVKPRVVFFGGSVPPDVTAASLAAAGRADVLLAVGTTLSTWSAFRLAKATRAGGGVVALLNAGPTRADDLAAVRVGAHATPVLRALAAGLLPGGGVG